MNDKKEHQKSLERWLHILFKIQISANNNMLRLHHLLFLSYLFPSRSLLKSIECFPKSKKFKKIAFEIDKD
jgi:hypothetical protein